MLDLPICLKVFCKSTALFSGFCVAKNGHTLNIDYFQFSCSLILVEDLFSSKGCSIKHAEFESGERFACYKFKSMLLSFLQGAFTPINCFGVILQNKQN